MVFNMWRPLPCSNVFRGTPTRQTYEVSHAVIQGLQPFKTWRETYVKTLRSVRFYLQNGTLFEERMGHFGGGAHLLAVLGTLGNRLRGHFAEEE